MSIAELYEGQIKTLPPAEDVPLDASDAALRQHDATGRCRTRDRLAHGYLNVNLDRAVWRRMQCVLGR